MKAMNIVKKAFTWSVVLTTILWSVGAAALAPLAVSAVETCPTLSAGDLYLVDGNTAVFYVTEGMKARYFPNGQVFEAWYGVGAGSYDGTIYTLTAACAGAYPQESSQAGINFPPGSLVQQPVGAGVYYVGFDNQVSLLGSADDARALFGDDWAMRIAGRIHTYHWANYNSDGATALSADVYPEGLLVRVDDVVYYIMADGLAHVMGGELGYLAGTVVDGSADMLPTVSEEAVSADTVTADPSQGVATVVDAPEGEDETPVVVGDVTVSIAATTPVGVQAALGSLYNDVLHFNLKAGSDGASVTGFTLKKTGLVANTHITGVSVWDDAGVRHGAIATALDDNGQVTIGFGNNPINIAANGTETVSVKVNVLSTATATNFQMGVVAVESAAAVAGLPVYGNQSSIVSGTLASYTITTSSVSGYSAESTAQSSSNEGQLEIGDVQKEAGKWTFAESGNEDLEIEEITFYIQGTVNEESDLKNWTLYGPANEVLGTTEFATDRYVTVPVNYTLLKGYSKTLTLKVDVVEGSNKYFAVSIQNDYDTMAKGLSTGYFVAPNVTTFPSAGYIPGNAWFKMKQGTLSVQKDTLSPSSNVPAGSTDAVLGVYTLKAIGEDVEIRKMALEVEVGQPADADLTGNVKVQSEDGSVTYLSTAYSNVISVASTGDSAFTTGTQRDLSTYLTIKSGETKKIRIVANVADGATASDTYLAKVGQFYLKRLSTLDFQTKPSATVAYPANSLTVSAATLTLAKNTAVGNKTIALGEQDVVLGSFKLQGGTSEDINVTTVVVDFTTTTAIENVGLWDGDTLLGSEIVSPSHSSSNTFSVNLTVPMNTVKTISVKGDVKTDTARDADTMTSTVAALTAVGATTGQDATGSVSATALQTMTFGTAKLKVTNDSSVESKILISGSSQLLAVTKYEAINADVRLTKLTYSLRTEENTGSASSSNYGDLELRDADGTVLATATVVDDGTDVLVTFTGFEYTVEAGTTDKLSVYADITESGVMEPATVGVATVYSDSSTYLEAYASTGLLARSAVGSSTNPTANETYFATSSPMLFHNTTPIIEKSDASPSGTASPDTETTLLVYTISNPGVRDMRISTTSVYISAAGLGTGGYVYDFKLFDGSTELANAVTTAGDSGTNLVTTTLARTIHFSIANDTSSRLADFIVSPGETKTFKVTADTSAIRTGLTTSNATLSAKIDGATGYSDGETGYEDNWSNGVVYYYYTPVNGSENSTAYTASDSYDISGSALTF
ncbi:MAG: hypothetical protein HOE80_02345 [Candidatus Magasanikbacteria bacterium]|nr:hypothetical protein [Candidatus Magasanikbacteria bacterium]MBT4071540.1 hypothetical protein [Candidatus Magasanikbacteria bacterium]